MSTIEKTTVSLWVYTTPSEPGTTAQEERDLLVMEAVGRECDGSGYDFGTGERDLSFTFDVEEPAELGCAIVEVSKLEHVQRAQVL